MKHQPCKKIFEEIFILRYNCLLIFLLLFRTSLFSQTNTYWQQQVNYTIDVSLNDVEHSLTGFEKIQYYNNSPDTLHFIWFHLWPNAYKNDKTAFSDQLLENGRTDFYFSDEEKRGYINRLNFKVNNTVANVEDHPQHQDIIKLVLPAALAPGAVINIETPFHVKLPYNFSRGGHIGQSYQATQWYPKPAVYDKYGWHEMPYLDQGEFYSEFGNYEVSITLPANYILAATGKVDKEITEPAMDGNWFGPEAKKKGEKKEPVTSPSAHNSKTITYKQNNVHDFAWFADKDFAVLQDTMKIGEKIINIYSYFNKASSDKWKNSIAFIKAAVNTKSAWIGEYPYDVVSVVERPGKADGGGMEYPTITLVSKPVNDKMLDLVINHEVGHNWFYGIIASNERDHPWMDEGINSYYDKRYAGDHAMQPIKKSAFIANREPADIENVLLATITKEKKDQPIETISEKFSWYNYDLIAYTKTAEWMKLLENELGKEQFDKVMQEYYQRWKFKHPYPEDFKKVAEEVSSKDLSSVFSLLNKTGSLEKPYKKDVKLTPFFSLKETMKHHYIFLAPAIGANFYDKIMVGAFIHNYTLPLSKFQFFVSPLYATGSKEFNGIGRLSYHFYPGKKDQQIEIAVAGAKFTGDSFTDSTGTKNYQPFIKLVPSVKYIFANKNPRSHFTKYIQWKSFLIRETGLLFSRDTIQQKDIISYPTSERYINQLRFVISNSRVLYPYEAIVQAQQGKGFVRLDFTGNYFFNYPRAGGLNVRLFAGKFIYTGAKTFITQYETDPYQLNMSGPKGYEDYTYSNYFVGRNEFDGLSSQQIMIRDGAFKVRTDFLSNKVGKTDDWLTAANLATTIPKQVNPLEVLPVKIPLKIFFDIGTYAEAWKKNAAGGKFLYDGGLQLSLFKNVINIYCPIIYSKVYSDYFKSTITEKRFQKNISFSIDFQNLSLKKLFPQSPL